MCSFVTRPVSDPDALPDVDWHARRRRRDEALLRIEYAWLAALLSGGLGLVFLAWLGIDTGEWRDASLYALGLALSVGLAWRMRVRHSQLAAGVLLVNAVLAPILRYVTAGQFGGLLMAGVLIWVYGRAFDATMTLAEERRHDGVPPAG
jgi:predicted anti-sigma-YlaC factor YlaD